MPCTTNHLHLFGSKLKTNANLHILYFGLTAALLLIGDTIPPDANLLFQPEA